MKIKARTGARPRFIENVAQHPGDLGLAGLDRDFHHQRAEVPAAAEEAGGFALAEAPVIDQLNLKAAMRGGRREHRGLKALRQIPGGLPAHRRIERKDQAAAPGRRRRGLARRGDELIDIRLRVGISDDGAAVRWALHGFLAVHGRQSMSYFSIVQSSALAPALQSRQAGSAITASI